MSKREEYERKTEELVMPFITENNFELVDVEYVKEAGNWYLRVYIDKENGITVDDCEIISRALSDKLDSQDFIEDSYILEVSSPGLGRPLKKEKDFKRSIGKEVEVKLYKAINRQKDFEGVLKAYSDTEITIEIDENEEMTFLRNDIALIRLSFDF
ncbi:MAG: ribosome maturation factor RimP [Lachnospiraceae bacterium]|nr:ribosome maturation factor RimP [Lachnospiraceae bacterium]